MGKAIARKPGLAPRRTQPQDRHKGPPHQPRFTLTGALPLALACSLVAIVAMFTNLSYGLPLLYHPDEARKVQVVAEIAQGQIPRYFDFAHPHFMLLFGIPFVLVGQTVGVSPHLAVRAAVATLGVATVALLYVVGRTLGGRPAALVASLFYATAPLAVVAAHDFKEDIPLAFWLTLQLFFLVRYLQGARLRDLYFSGIALGGAMGAKYTGFVASGLLVGAVLLGPTSIRRWKALGIAALLAGFTFLLCTPGLLLDPKRFLFDAGFEAQHAIFGHGLWIGVDPEGRFVGERRLQISALSYLWSYHLRYSLLPGISAAGLLLTLIGAGLVFAKRDVSLRLVASGLVLFYFVLETLPLKPPPFAARYMVAVLPYAALLCGRAVGFALEGPMPGKLLIGLVAAVTLALNGAETLRQVRAMQPETRDEARSWIFQNVPPGSRLVLPGVFNYTPLRYPALPPNFPYKIVSFHESPSSQILAASLDPGAYLIVSSLTYQRYVDRPDFDPDMSRFYRMLFERYTPLATFSAPFQPLGFHNPTIKIFRLSENSPAPAFGR